MNSNVIKYQNKEHGLDIASLKAGHNSRPRNPKIADACFKAGYIDTWGRGTLKIINSCKEAELPEPEVVEKDGGVQVTVFKETKGGQVGGPIGGPIDNSEAKNTGNLTDRQLEVLDIIRENNKISISKLAEVLGINVSAAQNHIDALKKKGAVERRGGTRGNWFVTENDKNDNL